MNDFDQIIYKGFIIDKFVHPQLSGRYEIHENKEPFKFIERTSTIKEAKDLIKKLAVKEVKKYRFFYHYYRQYNCLSIHFKGKCHRVKNIVCQTKCESHWNKTQPNLIMRGFAVSVEIIENVAYIK